jgi:hypothetical protein
MPFARVAAFAAAILIAMPSLAHQPDIPADIPAEYPAECGSCHVAYPPALLSESDWRDIMHRLDKHYGDNADLAEETRSRIEEFLARNAESYWKAHFPTGNPPRLTSTLWYSAHHLPLPDRIWSDKRVGSRSNCSACHAKAEKLLFDKYDLTDVPAEYGIKHERPAQQQPGAVTASPLTRDTP